MDGVTSTLLDQIFRLIVFIVDEAPPSSAKKKKKKVVKALSQLGTRQKEDSLIYRSETRIAWEIGI